MEEEQHVCLPAGFNLKHMYWLPLPSQLRFETTTAQFLCLLIWSRPWLGGGDSRPFPVSFPTCSPGIWLGHCPLDRVALLSWCP